MTYNEQPTVETMRLFISRVLIRQDDVDSSDWCVEKAHQNRGQFSALGQELAILHLGLDFGINASMYFVYVDNAGGPALVEV